MGAATHVVLVRGINVGGRNRVPMAQLRDHLTERGFTAVRTYIASGNVLVRAPRRSATAIATTVEACLAEDFGVDTVVVALPVATLREAVAAAPDGFGSEPGTYHSDIVFLRPGVSSADALAAFPLREGVDAAWAGDGVVYFRRLSAQRTKSRMGKVTESPLYKDMTIRSWTTATALVGLLDEAD